MKRSFLGLFMLILIVGSVAGVSTPGFASGEPGQSKVIFDMADSTGDELGAGGYTYPTHEHFRPYHGLFDLTHFTIKEGKLDYIFQFAFGEIQNPWRSSLGFSHPLIQLYIDNVPGGSKSLFRPGARVNLDQRAPWDVLLHITGWWVRAYHPADREKLLDTKYFWNMDYNPFDVRGAKITLQKKVIQVNVPKKTIGPLDGAKVFLLVGSFDPFGYDNFRDVMKKSDRWVLGGNKWGDFGTRVLDVILPEGLKQSEVLAVKPGMKQYVTVPYLTCPGSIKRLLAEEKIQLYIVTVLVGLVMVLAIVIKSKKNPLSA